LHSEVGLAGNGMLCFYWGMKTWGRGINTVLELVRVLRFAFVWSLPVFAMPSTLLAVEQARLELETVLFCADPIIDAETRQKAAALLQNRQSVCLKTEVPERVEVEEFFGMRMVESPELQAQIDRERVFLEGLKGQQANAVQRFQREIINAKPALRSNFPVALDAEIQLESRMKTEGREMTISAKAPASSYRLGGVFEKKSDGWHLFLSMVRPTDAELTAENLEPGENMVRQSWQLPEEGIKTVFLHWRSLDASAPYDHPFDHLGPAQLF